MFQLVRGNLLRAEAEALVNTVNTVGVMGKGIALQFKKAFPANFESYRQACEQGQVQVGKVFTTEINQLGGPKFIINFPTKEHWKGQSRLEFVQSGLAALVAEVKIKGIHSIAIPPLGCGLGGLPWTAVKRLIEDAFTQAPEVDVLLYEPAGEPEAVDQPVATKRPQMTMGRAAFLGLLGYYSQLLFYEEPTLLEVQKITYFLQETGENLKLQFTKGPYGPYADSLRHVLGVLEGHYITGWGAGENKPGQKIGLKPGAYKEALSFLESHPETKERFAAVARLVEGFESPYGMELLGTVHWVASYEVSDQERNTEHVAPLVRSWTKRKESLFSPRHIDVALSRLRDQHFV